MRYPLALPLLLLSVACATPARLVVTSSDMLTTVPDAADALAAADVVVLGETHRTPAVHALHHELIVALHERRPNMVVAMEMFERDVQTVLLQYLAGVVDESTFLAQARPWPHYDTDYRPVVEFAREHGLLVLAANAPRELVSRVAREGIDSVAGERGLPRETTAPEDEYWDDFVETMSGDHGAHAHGSLPNLYAAQCLRDDTMAETVVDHLRARREVGDRPLCVLICGRGHSDFGRGTVARIKSRMPDVAVEIVSTELVDDLGAATYSVPRSIGDYVVVAEGEAEPRPMRKDGNKPKAGTVVAAPVAPPPVAPEDPPAVARNPEGLRPALGFMPDYADAGGDGVLVGPVSDGGPAYEAGIEEGDYVTAIAGIDTPDLQTYVEVLDEQIIGRTITVRVRRGDAQVDLQCKVGSRQAR